MNIMWATRRRTITVFIVLAFLGLVVLLPYYLLNRIPPSCTDGKKNQNEQGIDCGGACVLVCPGGAKDLSIIWTKVFPVRPGVYDVVAYIENTNFDIGVPSLPYVARLYDTDGTVIAEQSGVTHIDPSERFAIFVGGMRTGDKIAVKGGIEITNMPRFETANKPTIVFSVKDKVLIGSDRKPKLTALLQNDTPEVYRNVQVTTIIYDAKGEPIGVSSTVVDKIDKNSSEKIFFTWPTPFNFVSETTQCELPVDVILAVDRSGSMVEVGKLDAAKASATQFVDRLGAKDQVGYVSFATTASEPIDQPLTSEIARVKRAIGRTEILKNQGLQFTNIADGLSRAVNELSSNRHEEDSRSVIVLLTDGIPTRPEDPNNKTNKEYPSLYAKEIAEKAKAQGIGIYAIGLGDDVKGPFLSSLTTSPEYYYKAASGAELGDVYQQIATAICKKGPSVIEIIPRLNNVQ